MPLAISQMISLVQRPGTPKHGATPDKHEDRPPLVPSPHDEEAVSARARSGPQHALRTRIPPLGRAARV